MQVHRVGDTNTGSYACQNQKQNQKQNKNQSNHLYADGFLFYYNNKERQDNKQKLDV